MKVQHCKSHGVPKCRLKRNGCISGTHATIPRMRSISFRERGQDLWTMCNFKSPGLDGPSAVCGGHGSSVFTAACLAVSRYFATAGLRSAAFCTPARRIPRRPSNLTFVAVPQLKRSTSRHRPSALRGACSPWAEGGGSATGGRRDVTRSHLCHLHQQSAGSETQQSLTFVLLSSVEGYDFHTVHQRIPSWQHHSTGVGEWKFDI